MALQGPDLADLLNGREPLDRIRKKLHQVDQERRLRIRFGASLFPFSSLTYERDEVCQCFKNWFGEWQCNPASGGKGIINKFREERAG